MIDLFGVRPAEWVHTPQGDSGRRAVLPQDFANMAAVPLGATHPTNTLGTRMNDCPPTRTPDIDRAALEAKYLAERDKRLRSEGQRPGMG